MDKVEKGKLGMDVATFWLAIITSLLTAGLTRAEIEQTLKLLNTAAKYLDPQTAWLILNGYGWNHAA